MNNSVQIKILASALAANVFLQEEREKIIRWLANQPGVKEIVKGLGNSKLIRESNLVCKTYNLELPKLEESGNKVFYANEEIGEKRILYKSPLPGELQARLSYESIADRFLEYLQKVHHVVVLNESNFHVQIFIPGTKKIDFTQEWKEFITGVAFSTDGNSKYKLPGLKHTLIQMLNSITLAGRGFSTVEVPIITKEQSNVLAAWYFAVVKQVEKRQLDREKSIDYINKQINNLKERLEKEKLEAKEIKQIKKDRAKYEKDFKSKQEMQAKEAKKYHEYFLKGLNKILEEHGKIFQDINNIEDKLKSDALKRSQINQLQKQKDKLKSKLIFSEESVKHKQNLLQQSQGDPFKFVNLDLENNSQLQIIKAISKPFTKTATDQINSTRGDIFTQCILEMYRLIESEKLTDSIPEPLFTEQPHIKGLRSAGDDGKDFCYSCGVALNSKNAKWKVARFMFERPSQRRQSSNSEDRPFICSSCSILAFASPLKVTDESIILQLKSKSNNTESQDKLKDYLRMLTNKELHLSSGRYVILTSDKTSNGVIASQKLGQIQYALLKTASIFPLEVLEDFKFNLILQGNQSKELSSRYLILLKGLMEAYGQKIIASGDINLKLGDAVRYVEQDSPYLAEYTIVRVSKISNPLEMERVRRKYWRLLQQDMSVNSKRAKLYQDVAALIGITYPFVDYAEYLIKKHQEERESKKETKSSPEDLKKEVAREISKIIENSDELQKFCYYSCLGNENRFQITATLKRNRNTHFIYDQARKLLLEELKIADLKEKSKDGELSITLSLGDVEKVYFYFANDPEYSNDQGWNELTYNLKISLYTRFPELVRKLNKKGDK
ncbi:conserved hypothetical protein [Hyella patelloides LEGE 07179]|uniref:Uncharacterized protein n=1 Tax=Hyella patelloides LEGE 07179 TaxID=945734 RepID=A0A563VRB3_9CYAN|nr:hypothetical protein [Hyella patelloides]VEP13998.1 conserved hypothetical protein [Hyella patelloides LEGE 07179]